MVPGTIFMFLLEPPLRLLDLFCQTQLHLHGGLHRELNVLHCVSEHFGEVVVKQRVDHTVHRCKTQRHYHTSMQWHHDPAVPLSIGCVYVQCPEHMIGQEADQEGHCHHGDKMNGAASVRPLNANGTAGNRGVPQVSNDAGVAGDECEERQQKAQNQGQVVNDQDVSR